MGDMKDAISNIFSFSEEEKEKLSKVSSKVLELIKSENLTIREVLFVLNRCEHIVLDEAIGGKN